MSKIVFSGLLVQTQIKLHRMMACLWGDKGSRSADVASFRLPLAFRECAWSAEGHPGSPYFHTVAIRIGFQCIPYVFTSCRL